MSRHQTIAMTTGRGFTLIEMMIVVMVIAVLAAIALPSYTNYVIRANRSAAQQFLLDLGNHEEQYRIDARSYAGTAALLNMSTSPDLATNYTVAIATTGNDCLGNAIVAPAYVITATAIGSQAADGDLCFDNLGSKTPPAKWQQ